MDAAARFIASGRVQGVFFRASTRAEAERLGLRGLAKNLPDGDVEVLVAGPSEALEALERWLRRGPPQARVDALVRQDLDPAHVPGDGFATV